MNNNSIYNKANPQNGRKAPLCTYITTLLCFFSLPFAQKKKKIEKENWRGCCTHNIY